MVIPLLANQDLMPMLTRLVFLYPGPVQFLELLEKCWNLKCHVKTGKTP